VVEIGACASKFVTGSTFPLVEITLRILPFATIAVRTGMVSSRREINAPSKMTAVRIASAVTHQRRGWRAELLPFNGIEGKE
jgi:hypothetical protein